MEYNNEVLKDFISCDHRFNKWKGINAKEWGEYFLEDNFSKKLNKKLTREDLLNINFKNTLSNKELSVAILSWGGMNREHGRLLFQNNEWLSLIDEIRTGKINSRKVAYKKFKDLRKDGKLKGMGPAYFTKLICFVSSRLNGYIMDQWTSKSINILLGKNLIKLTKSGTVTDKNNLEIYELFCQTVEDLAKKMSVEPIELEEMLFSNGGVNKGTWRNYVVNKWGHNKASKKINKFNNTDMESITFEDALQQLPNDEINIPTLGGRSTLKIKAENNLIYITNSKNNTLGIDKAHWNKVMSRIEELPQDERGMTSRYGVGKHQFNWTECPNQVFSIYIPAIVNYLLKINHQKQ